MPPSANCPAARAPRLQLDPMGMRRPRRVLVFVAAFLALAASAVHAQPARPLGRVLLFPEPNYRGDPLVVEVGTVIDNLEYVGNGGHRWNDRISSVRLEGPVLLIMYENAGFRGAQAALTRDAADLGALSLGDRRGSSWDRRMSSLRVEEVQRGGPVILQWSRGDAESAVRSAFRDILGREPDDFGLREYRERLIERGWTEDQLRDNLRQSPEFRSRDLGAIIRKGYRDLLGRDPDPSGLATYTRALKNGMSEAEFRADLHRSGERATLAARETVTRAYREVLRREPDPAGLANYMKLMLERGWDENRVREALRNSDEYRRLPKR